MKKVANTNHLRLKLSTTKKLAFIRNAATIHCKNNFIYRYLDIFILQICRTNFLTLTHCRFMMTHQPDFTGTQTCSSSFFSRSIKKKTVCTTVKRQPSFIKYECS